MITLPLEMAKEMRSIAKIFNKHKNKEAMKWSKQRRGESLDFVFFELREGRLLFKMCDGLTLLFKEYPLKGIREQRHYDFGAKLSKFANSKILDIFIDNENRLRIKKFFDGFDCPEILNNRTKNLINLEFAPTNLTPDHFGDSSVSSILEGCEVLSVGKRDDVYKIVADRFTLITLQNRGGIQ